MRLLLVRHGRTAWNAERRFLGATDLPLDDVGLGEALALGRERAGRFAAIWSSPMQRARQTADPLRPPEVRIEPDLREIAEGELEGLTASEAVPRYPDFFAAFATDPGAARPPGGETMGEVRDRAFAALLRIAGHHAPGEHVAVVTHQIVIASVVCTLRGEPLTEWRRYGVPNAGTAELAFDGQRLTIA